MSKKVIPLSFDDPAFEEDIKQQQERKKNDSKMFEKGVYDVVVTEVEEKGPAADENWTKIMITLQGTGEKKIKHYIMLPTGGQWKYVKDDKGTMLPAHNFKNFAAALGVENPASVIEKCLNKSIIGSHLKMETEWRRGTFHLEYNKEIRALVLLDHLSKPVKASEGRTFAKREEAELFCAQNNLKYCGFVDAKQFSPPALPNVFKTEEPEDADIPADESDTPF